MSHPFTYTALPDLTGGACLGLADKTMFFPEGMGAKQQADYALSICARCPVAVKETCLADALDYEARMGACHGIVGGLLPEDRAAILKKRRTA